MLSYSDKTAIWFHKPTALNQPLFQMPLVGYVTGSQGALFFGVGLPAFFVVMNAYGIMYALIPLGAVAAFALIRPPVMGYETRLAVLVWFYTRRRRPKMTRSAALKVPVPASLSIPKAAKATKAAGRPAEPLRVRGAGRPVEISMALRTGGNRARRGHVRIMLDGSGIKTAVPSGTGRVSIILHPEDCVGTRTISIHEVDNNDSAGALLVSKEVVFE
jgi:hypothetical protein